MAKKLGMIVYDTTTGLGYQTLEFCKLLKPEKILIANLKKFNGLDLQGFYKNHSNKRISEGIPNREDLEWLTDGVDTVFIIETPLNTELYKICEQKNIKLIMQYNYEFLNLLVAEPKHNPYMLIAPTNWHYREVDNYCSIYKIFHKEINVPTTEPDIEIKKTDRIFHIAGRVAKGDRNGTQIFLDYILHKKDKKQRYDLFVLSPKDNETEKIFHEIKPKIEEIINKGYNLKVFFDTKDRWSMYREGGILLLPRRYGGLCLPMIEALSVGIPVLMPNIPPNNEFLPVDWLYNFESSYIIKKMGKYGVVESFNSNIESIDCIISDIDLDLASRQAKRIYNKFFNPGKLKKQYISLF